MERGPSHRRRFSHVAEMSVGHWLRTSTQQTEVLRGTQNREQSQIPTPCTMSTTPSDGPR
jgi:hypothetical protein